MLYQQFFRSTTFLAGVLALGLVSERVEASSPWCKSSVVSRAAMRPDGKARRARIFAICERGATLPVGMQRRPNAAGLAPRAANGGAASPQSDERRSRVRILEGPGSEIGISIRDVDQADVAREKLSAPAGAVVEDVRSDGPAAKAGLRSGDVIVEFDGEKVRGARHLTRLVHETPANRTIKGAVVRGGQRTDFSVTPDSPSATSASRWAFDLSDDVARGRSMALELGDLNLDLGARLGGGRLGVTVQDLTPQLASYFGAKDGVLVTSVSEDSAAARAGLKAGDVITTVAGESVTSRSDLIRTLARADDNRPVAIGVVREKHSTTVQATLEKRSMRRRSVRRTG